VMLDCIPFTGHCYTADGFTNYVEAVRQGRLREGQYLRVCHCRYEWQLRGHGLSALTA
jgi:hypothetical protein